MRPRFQSDLVLAEKEPAWHGSVERRDATRYQKRSEVRTWMCRSCRTWTMYGAYKTGRCNWCGAKRPAS